MKPRNFINFNKVNFNNYELNAVLYYLVENKSIENVCNTFKCSQYELNGWINKYNKDVYIHYKKPLIIICQLPYYNIKETINIILKYFCDLQVCGYNSKTSEYWGKKINNNECELYFTLCVESNEFSTSNETTTSTITINIIIGIDVEIKQLISNIKKSINYYKVSKYTTNCFENIPIF